MRIAVVGSQNVGKSTFISDFLNNWPMYKKSGDSYRKLVKKKNLTLNKEGSEESQGIILEALLKETRKYKKKENIIHDRIALDNLIYTMWLKDRYPDKISDLFVEKTIHKVKRSFDEIDLIMYLPHIEKYSIQMEERENREVDVVYREEIDNIFKAVFQTYLDHKSWFFDFQSKKGVPAVVEIFGNREERIEMAKLYINPDGSSYSEDESLISDIN